MALQFPGDELSRVYSPMMNNLAYQNTNGLLAGCEVTEDSGGASMDLDVSSGNIFFSTTLTSVTAGSVTIAANATAYTRLDIVVVNGAGTLSVVQGTAGAVPYAPDYDPDTYIALALVEVSSGASSIVTANITDVRVLNTGGAGGGDSSIGRYREEFTSTTSLTVTHNLGDAKPMVQVYDSSAEFIIPDTIDITDENTVDITFSSATAGHVVVYGGVGTATSYYSKSFSSATSWTVNHNLGRQYVTVQCYNTSDELIEPQSVTLNSDSQCTVTFGSATAGRVVVVGGASDLGPEYGYIEINSMQADTTAPPASGLVGFNPTLDFDDTTDEIAYFSFKVPQDADTSVDMTLELTYCMASTNSSAAVVVGLDINSIADGEDGTPASAHSTTTETVSVPNTAEEVDVVETTTAIIANSIIAVNDQVSCKFYRDANNGSDDASGDFQLLNLRVKYKRA